MKKCQLLICVVGASALLWFAIDGEVHADDRPPAARADTTQSKYNGGHGDRNRAESSATPATDKTITRAERGVRMGPTTVTVIDDGEAVDDVVSRVLQARTDRSRFEGGKQEAKSSPMDRGRQDGLHRERLNPTDKKADVPSGAKNLNGAREPRAQKAELRAERRDEANEKREQRREHIKEKREQRMQRERPVRADRSEK